MERKGYVLTAHLVRVALAPQPRDIQCPPSSPPKSRIRYAGQDDGPLSPMDLAEPSAEATQLSSLPPISTGTASTPQAMEVDGEGTSSYAAGGEALPAYQSKILKSAALDGLWGGVQGTHLPSEPSRLVLPAFTPTPAHPPPKADLVPCE